MSLKIGRLFGINLFIHWSFWLLPLWVAFMHVRDPESGSLAMHLGLLGALFACVVLHEYGHALAARQFGIQTHDVTLYPIGGVARLERMSEKPWEEFCIAIAGPLVNLVIAAALAAGLFAASFAPQHPLGGIVGEFAVWLAVMNIALFLFNLLPAFPMDGGRVLRALLTPWMGRLPATRAAVVISRGAAVLFGVIGFLYNPWLLFVAVFLIFAGQQELRALEARERWHDDEPEPITPEILPDTPRAWSGLPRTMVTVYVWDARKHEWIAQGVVPQAYTAKPWRQS